MIVESDLLWIKVTRPPQVEKRTDCNQEIRQNELISRHLGPESAMLSVTDAALEKVVQHHVCRIAVCFHFHGVVAHSAGLVDSFKVQLADIFCSEAISEAPPAMPMEYVSDLMARHYLHLDWQHSCGDQISCLQESG